MKIGDKTYELILPEFPAYDNKWSKWGGDASSTNMKYTPYFFCIKYDKRKKELLASMSDGEDYFPDCDIVHHLDHEITETDYNNMVQELQQAYKDWVFNTLFKEIEL